jgi:hypothetical protein
MAASRTVTDLENLIGPPDWIETSFICGHRRLSLLSFIVMMGLQFEIQMVLQTAFKINAYQ